MLNTGNKVSVFTEGSFCRRSGAGGWAFTVTLSGSQQHQASGPLSAQDNNAVEWHALMRAVDHLCEMELAPNTNVTFYADSAYCRDHFTPDRLLAAGASSAEVRHTRAHQGARNAMALRNEWVDRLAKEAMRAERDRLMRLAT